MEAEVLRRTWSVCPICLKRIAAERLRVGDEVFLRKACAEHGAFQSVIWRGRSDMGRWIGDAEGGPSGEPPCPEACGLCPEHLQRSCCVLLEVTRRCDLACRFCFADGVRADSGDARDPSFEELEASISRLVDPGKTLLQLSGGEPAMRDDLPRIVAAAKEAGCRYVQLNSNGIRLAEDPGYARSLAEAGLSFVFLQFDGTDEAIYEKLRGRPLLEVKLRAIANCAAQNLGLTLVPTLVRGVNTGDIGAILRFGMANSPAVRGVHFQPVSFFGRIPGPPSDDMRFTLDELMFEIERQTGGMVRRENLLPSRCDHPLCGFHGDFVVAPQGLMPLSRKGDLEERCCCGPAGASAPAEKNRRFVARRWERPPEGEGDFSVGDMRDMGYFLARVRSHGFTVTAMAFQDAWNLDLERLRRCSLHVFEDGRLVPFCAHYLSGWKE